MKTPLSHYGGKARIASQIVLYIHRIPHTVYSEPFCGGLAVLYAKRSYDRGNSSNYREAINDKNKNLVTFWRIAREFPEKLTHWIEYTPYSQEDHRKSLEIYNNPFDYSDLEIAWAVYVQCNASFARGIGKGWGTATLSQNLAATWTNKKNRLPQCFERLKNLHIDCEDALDFIDRWDSPQTLHYIDPPYPNTSQGHYDDYTLEDYQSLCDKLDSVEGSYILSNYHQEISPKSAQRSVDIETVMSAANGKARKDKDCKRIEKVWICDRSAAMRSDIKKISGIEDEFRILQYSLF